MNIASIIPSASVALADKVREMERSGSTIVKLQTGDPDFATHPAIIEATAKAMRDGLTHYSDSAGLLQLRNTIAGKLHQQSGYAFTPREIVITNGAAEAIFSATAALIEAGDEAIVAEPAWPTVKSLVKLAGGVPVPVSFLGEEDWCDALEKKITPRTRMVCLNTPNNPTGKVFDPQTISRIVEICRRHNLYLLLDEVYQFLTYTNEAGSGLTHFGEYEKLIYVNSFSKTYAMTGFRIGYVAAREPVAALLVKASQLAVTHVAPFVQMGALEALTNPEVAIYSQQMRSTFRERRDVVEHLLQEKKLEAIPQQGAFYAFIRTGGDDVRIAQELLRAYHVCVVPGSAYGDSGTGFLRITYATGIAEVQKGINAIADLLASKQV